MQRAFADVGVFARVFDLSPSEVGAEVETKAES
jgi:hypothetical protein